MNFILETASNRGVNLGAVSKKGIWKKKFASEDKQVHSPNINNESSFVKITLNFFLCELFISVFFVLTNWKKKASNTFHILLLIFIRITHTVVEFNQTKVNLCTSFSQYIFNIIYHMEWQVSPINIQLISTLQIYFLAKYIFLFWKIYTLNYLYIKPGT